MWMIDIMKGKCSWQRTHTCVLLDTTDLLGAVFPLLDLLPGLVDRCLCQTILQSHKSSVSRLRGPNNSASLAALSDAACRCIVTPRHARDMRGCNVSFHHDNGWKLAGPIKPMKLLLTLMSLYLGSNFFAESTVS